MDDPARWLDIVSQCKYLPENHFHKLCNKVSEIFLEECSVAPVSTPVTVCGDIHGHFHDLLHLFLCGGTIPNCRYIFMGNYVDWGYNSLETITLLLILKVTYPDKIVLLRGNHECRLITQVYGFYDECINKYGNANAWRACCKVFDLLTVAALIDETVLCVHGGLSPVIKTLDQIRTIDRNQEIPHKGPFCDIVWSDPDDVSGWKSSPRGAGYLFGPQETRNFSSSNGLKLICRGHQFVHNGYKYLFDNQLLSIWSLPNHCYRLGNQAAIVTFHDGDWKEAKVFGPSNVEGKNKVISRIFTPYCLQN